MSSYQSFEVCYIVVYVINKLIEDGLIDPNDKKKLLLKNNELYTKIILI